MRTGAQGDDFYPRYYYLLAAPELTSPRKECYVVCRNDRYRSEINGIVLYACHKNRAKHFYGTRVLPPEHSEYDQVY